jgi:hypothetical protein
LTPLTASATPSTESLALQTGTRYATNVSEPTEPTAKPSPPPRAFGQGVGTVFQVVGVVLFITSMFICCASSLVSKDVETQTELNYLGWWHYSAQLAVTV